jgi:hypothetical protein
MLFTEIIGVYYANNTSTHIFWPKWKVLGVNTWWYFYPTTRRNIAEELNL